MQNQTNVTNLITQQFLNELSVLFSIQQTQPFSFDIESKDYAGFELKLNSQRIICRTAKITPTKTGCFVTLWKRNAINKTTQPFEANDEVSLVLVFAKSEFKQGFFIFTENVLVEKGIFRSPQKAGKCATRLYPPWSEPTAKDAIRSKQWQVDYFLELTIISSEDCAESIKFDVTKAQQLFKKLI